MTNALLLRKKIAESGLKKSFIADAINMTLTGFEKKLVQQTEFKPSQIIVLCDLLRIEDPEERKEIFLI